MTTLYDFSVTTIDQQQKPLADYRGKVILIVNTASYCGFTPQYRELQKLYEHYRNEQFEILAFPCNQFALQEPKNNQEIAEFCQLKYRVTFPVFAKIAVNGKYTEPLFRYLKTTCPGLLGTQAIKWNFTKFLVDRNGIVVKRYAPIISPRFIMADIERHLGVVHTSDV